MEDRTPGPKRWEAVMVGGEEVDKEQSRSLRVRGQALRMSTLWNGRLRCPGANGSLFSQEEKQCGLLFFPFA